MTPAEKDLALVRRVAELMGLHVIGDKAYLVSNSKGIYVEERLHLATGPENLEHYWPLTDDAQCFAVLMRMSKTATVCIGNRGVSWHISSAPVVPVPFENDTDEARRRAILECFAKGS